MGSSSASSPAEASIFRQDLVEPFDLPDRLAHLGRDVTSSGNIQERSFFQAFGPEIARHSFIGHLGSPFTYDIDPAVFDEDPAC